MYELKGIFTDEINGVLGYFLKGVLRDEVNGVFMDETPLFKDEFKGIFL